MYKIGQLFARQKTTTSLIQQIAAPRPALFAPVNGFRTFSVQFPVFQQRYDEEESEHNIFDPSSRQQQNQAQEQDHQQRPPAFKILVKNLPWTTEWPQVKDLFAPVAHVHYARVLKDTETGRSRGKAFVHFSSEEDRQRALEQLNNIEYEGRQLTMLAVNVDSAPFTPRGASAGGEHREQRYQNREQSRNQTQRQRPSNQGRQLFVGRIPREADEGALRQFLGQVGTVQYLRIVRDRESGQSRGFGFVCYSSTEEADRALQELSGAEFEGSNLFLKLDEKAE